jgi:hypothetical protein
VTSLTCVNVSQGVGLEKSSPQVKPRTGIG